MKPEEIIDIFKEKGTQCTMYRDDPTSLVYGLYECKILEILVTLKCGTELTIFCGESTVIDISKNEDEYAGFGSTLVSPMKDIECIEVKWR